MLLSCEAGRFRNDLVMLSQRLGCMLTATLRPASGMEYQDRHWIVSGFAFIVQPRGIVPHEQATAKEILFVLDTSGSMSGAPLRMSKAFIDPVPMGEEADDRFIRCDLPAQNEVLVRDAVERIQRHLHPLGTLLINLDVVTDAGQAAQRYAGVERYSDVDIVSGA